jgi:magnesium-transporting ATPase (P-type)
VLKVPTSELVTGDLLWLRSGDRIPADIRVLHTDDQFRAEGSWITGEVGFCQIGFISII